MFTDTTISLFIILPALTIAVASNKTVIFSSEMFGTDLKTITIDRITDISMSEYTCSKQSESLFSNLQYRKIIFSRIEAGSSNSSQAERPFCEFNLDLLKLQLDIFPKLLTPQQIRFLKGVNWYCDTRTLMPNTFCNSFSACLNDECSCNTGNHSVFHCLDNSGCVSIRNTCDGSHDCKDGSDECMCEGFVQLKCSSLAFKPHCIPRSFLCSESKERWSLMRRCAKQSGLHLDCKSILFEIKDRGLKRSPLSLCMHYYITKFSGYGTNSAISYCQNNCSAFFKEEEWTIYCDKLLLGGSGSLGLSFMCDSGSFFLNKVCDGNSDCTDGADEMGCPGRFYCAINTTIEWVDLDKLCDNVKDCTNGADECAGCDMGPFSSVNFLISSHILFYLTLITGFLVVTLNARFGFKCYITVPSLHVGELDRIIRLQVYFYDFLMGIYLWSILLASLMIKAVKGDYCSFDQQWRSSSFCGTLGIIFTFSSHGSLLSIALMSVIRCVVCVKSDSTYIKKSSVVIISTVLLSFNLINSILPIVPLPALQEIFRTEIFLTYVNKNPFFKSNPLNYTLLEEAHHRVFNRKSTNLYQMLSDFRKTVTDSKIWHVTEISFYGNAGLCVHNIFKTQTSFTGYKISYVIGISFLLLLVSGAYSTILLKIKRSQKEVRGISRQHLNHNSAITKIVLMIGSQLLCWVPFIGAVIYHTAKPENTSPRMFYEVFALIVIPINSLLNPIFYSGLYRKIIDIAKERLPCITKSKPDAVAGVVVGDVDSVNQDAAL